MRIHYVLPLFVGSNSFTLFIPVIILLDITRTKSYQSSLFLLVPNQIQTFLSLSPYNRIYLFTAHAHTHKHTQTHTPPTHTRTACYTIRLANLILRLENGRCVFITLKVIHKEYSRVLNQFFPNPCLCHELNMIIHT